MDASGHVLCEVSASGCGRRPRLDSLDRPSLAMCDQLESVSRKRLVKPYRGRLASDEIDAIKFVLRQMIDVR